MPWNETSPMNERMQFIADFLRHRLSMTELCDQHNVSRKTGYKWIGRYAEAGALGLPDRSFRPHHSPQQTPAPIVAALVQALQRHPSWGAKKLVAILSTRHPDWEWPARRTVCAILDRHGLTTRPRRRRRIGHPGRPSSGMETPNQVWAADFKGQFKTGDRIYCYPLTVTDGCSRYPLACHGLLSTACADAKPIFTRVFREFGLPERIHGDNGVPFATYTLARLSPLSAWWVRLGILPEFIEPGKPRQNGRHERMHRTLKAETTRPAAATCRAQQRRFDRFRQEFNQERPHEALGQQTPASLYTTSPRPFPAKLPALEYPAHFERRYVSANGSIRWNHHFVNVSHTFIGEYVGLSFDSIPGHTTRQCGLPTDRHTLGVSVQTTGSKARHSLARIGSPLRTTTPQSLGSAMIPMFNRELRCRQFLQPRTAFPNQPFATH